MTGDNTTGENFSNMGHNYMQLFSKMSFNLTRWLVPILSVKRYRSKRITPESRVRIIEVPREGPCSNTVTTQQHCHHTATPSPHSNTVTTQQHHHHTATPSPHSNTVTTQQHRHHTATPSPHSNTVTTQQHRHHTATPPPHSNTVTTHTTV